MSFQLYMRL